MSCPTKSSHVLVLGAYGLVGVGISKHLSIEGFKVSGLGRNSRTAHRVLPDLNWIIADLRALTKSEDWNTILDGITAVVNCSGALQDNAEDDLAVIHHHMVSALATACADRDIKLVQISAVGAEPEASTAFLSTKALGDSAIRTSGARYTLFRPGLILASHAYGGTALLRMLAAIPYIQPIAYQDIEIQSVSLSDICHAVTLSLQDAIMDGYECDLVEARAHRLQDVLIKLRRWLGFDAARFLVALPGPVIKAISKGADCLSLLGWKSPLRTTAVTVLSEGIKGDNTAWQALGLKPLASIDQIFSTIHATAEDRLSARLSLLSPVMIATLSMFWILSGLIGLFSIEDASQVLLQAGWPQTLAIFSVVFWAIVDLFLGGAILVRRFANAACWGMIGTCLFYLMASSILVPTLWLDPLGPLVKVLPAMLLALVTRVTLEQR